jgi:hypothetical protein
MGPGAYLIHTRYGLCRLGEIVYPLTCHTAIFGIIIRPSTPWGQARLSQDSESDVPDFLEDSLRRLKPFQRCTVSTHNHASPDTTKETPL